MSFLLQLLILASPTDASATKLDAVLSCRAFINGLPQTDLSIPIKGTSPTQSSKIIQSPTRKYQVEISWDGFFEGYPRNPELRIRVLNLKDSSVEIEAYKNFDLHAHLDRQSISENDDNLGIRNSEDSVYLSCDFKKL